MSLGSGLAWGGREHRWERRTNYALLIGIIITGLFYYYNWSFTVPFLPLPTLRTGEMGLLFLILAGICHLFARISHSGEQFNLKGSRSWRK